MQFLKEIKDICFPLQFIFMLENEQSIIIFHIYFLDDNETSQYEQISLYFQIFEGVYDLNELNGNVPSNAVLHKRYEYVCDCASLSYTNILIKV